MTTVRGRYKLYPVLFRILACWITVAVHLCALSSSAIAVDFNDYDEDVAALLREYQAQTDRQGSYNPSVLMFNESSNQHTVVDFENGLIVVNATRERELKRAIIDVLLTQIDPTVIDAKTAQDLLRGITLSENRSDPDRSKKPGRPENDNPTGRPGQQDHSAPFS